MKDHLPLQPKFRTEGTNRQNARVFLQFSLCDLDIREIKMDESVDVTRAHLCKKCDPSQKIVVLNERH